MLKATEAQQRSLQHRAARGMMDAAGTAPTPRRASVWGGDGPSADGRGVTALHSYRREDNEAGKT